MFSATFGFLVVGSLIVVFVEDRPAHVYSVAGHVFGLAGVLGGGDVSSADGVRTD